MWSGGDVYNELGQPVRLYQPIPFGRTPSPCSSFIGGGAMYDIECRHCQSRLYQLAKVFDAQGKRYLQVAACNRASCFRSLFPRDDKLHYGGDGVVVCTIQTITEQENPTHIDDDSIPTEWNYVESVTNSETVDMNEWSLEPSTLSDSNDMDDLEAKLSALETKSKTTTPSLSSPTEKVILANQVTERNDATTGFPVYVLHELAEPPAVPMVDEDDVGLGKIGNRSDDPKIQAMLEKYLAEEDDETILQALRNSGVKTTHTSGVHGTTAERDERLSAADRALWTFTDRLKRAPRQVLRYASGGVPIWSIPVLTMDQQQQIESKRRNNTTSSTKVQKSQIYGLEKPLPPCTCGAKRMFEFQLLPSLLHVLQVDKFIIDTCETAVRNWSDSYENGGMDWGNIAFYTCSARCARDHGYCVVQDSVDGSPSMQQHSLKHAEDVVIQEDAKFNDDDDDEDDDEDEEDDCEMLQDDNDDGSVW